MKKIEISQKLSLNKETVASLKGGNDNPDQTICLPGRSVGGASLVVCPATELCPKHSVVDLLCTGARSGCPKVCQNAY